MRNTTLALLWLILLPLLAINDHPASDGATRALGGVSVVHDHPVAVMNNPAITATFQHPLVVTSFTSSFGIEQMGFGAVWPLRGGTIGGSVQRSGVLDYAEMKYGLYYARSFGANFSAAVQADVLSVVPQSSVSPLWAITGEVALWYQPAEHFSVGFHLFNIAHTHYAFYYYDEQIPVHLKLGFAYSVFDNFTLMSEFENSSSYGSSIRAGMQYTITDGIYLRTGAATNPVLASLGIAFQWKGVQVDVAAQAVRVLGKTGSLSLAYTF